MGASVALNGPLSYMGDVVTWGRPSRWKTADRVLATTNTLVTSSLIPFGALGLMHFPLASVLVLAVGIVAALLCKRRAHAGDLGGDELQRIPHLPLAVAPHTAGGCDDRAAPPRVELRPG